MKTIIASTLLLLAAATFVSAQSLTCQRTNLTQGGFTSIKVAESWFPQQSRFQINGARVRSDFHGQGTVKTTKNRVRMTFDMKSSNGNTFKMRVTYIPSSGRYTASMPARGGYAQITGAGGRCVTRS